MCANIYPQFYRFGDRSFDRYRISAMKSARDVTGGYIRKNQFIVSNNELTVAFTHVTVNVDHHYTKVTRNLLLTKSRAGQVQSLQVSQGFQGYLQAWNLQIDPLFACHSSPTQGIWQLLGEASHWPPAQIE